MGSYCFGLESRSTELTNFQVTYLGTVSIIVLLEDIVEPVATVFLRLLLISSRRTELHVGNMQYLKQGIYGIRKYGNSRPVHIDPGVRVHACVRVCVFSAKGIYTGVAPPCCCP